jgi:hypothetical protein
MMSFDLIGVTYYFLITGIFQESVSVVGASVCLDEGCMQLAQTMRVTSKYQTIPYEIMYDITKVGVTQLLLIV